MKMVLSEEEIKTILDRMKYAIKNNPHMRIQLDRNSDEDRDIVYTNRYTVNDLFPDEDPAVALKRELGLLTIGDYLETVTDTKYQNKKLHVFIKEYTNQVYIKIRAELLSASIPNPLVVVISFHYAEHEVDITSLPYA